MTKRRSPEEV